METPSAAKDYNPAMAARKEPKKKYQKAVSLYPLTLEEAVSRLLKAKPRNEAGIEGQEETPHKSEAIDS